MRTACLLLILLWAVPVHAEDEAQWKAKVRRAEAEHANQQRELIKQRAAKRREARRGQAEAPLAPAPKPFWFWAEFRLQPPDAR